MTDVEKTAVQADSGQATPSEKHSLNKVSEPAVDDVQRSGSLRAGLSSTWAQLTQNKGVDIGAQLFAEVENYSQEELEAEKDIVRRKIDWHIMPIVRHIIEAEAAMTRDELILTVFQDLLHIYDPVSGQAVAELRFCLRTRFGPWPPGSTIQLGCSNLQFRIPILGMQLVLCPRSHEEFLLTQ